MPVPPAALTQIATVARAGCHPLGEEAASEKLRIVRQRVREKSCSLTGRELRRNDLLGDGDVGARGRFDSLLTMQSKPDASQGLDVRSRERVPIQLAAQPADVDVKGVRPFDRIDSPYGAGQVPAADRGTAADH